MILNLHPVSYYSGISTMVMLEPIPSKYVSTSSIAIPLSELDVRQWRRPIPSVDLNSFEDIDRVLSVHLFPLTPESTVLSHLLSLPTGYIYINELRGSIDTIGQVLCPTIVGIDLTTPNAPRVANVCDISISFANSLFVLQLGPDVRFCPSASYWSISIWIG